MHLKRTAKYALTLVLGASMAMPAMAQDNFPDVPENHWAYKELARLKAEGLLVGYPDGLFRGGRPASRYEMAVAIHAAWSNLKGITDGLKGQIDDILRRIEGAPTKADIDNLRAAIDALQNQVKVNTDDIAALKRLIDEFRAELQRLGADVEQMKKDIAALDKRVTALEKSRLPFDVHGDLNLVGLGGYSDDDTFGMTVDGRPTGFGRGDYFAEPVGVTRDLTVLHEGALDLVSNNESGPKFRATFVFGNMLGGEQFFGPSSAAVGGPSAPFTGFGNQSTNQSGVPFGEGTAAWYAQRFYVDFDTSVASLGFNAKVGRVGYKINPMMYQRPDNSPYFSNDRWDDGEWMFDGAILGFRFGAAKFNVFGGRNSSRLATNGIEVQPMWAGNVVVPYDATMTPYFSTTGWTGITVDQSLGAHLQFPLGDRGAINLAYLWLDSNDVVNTGSSVDPFVNRVVVYGGDIKFGLGSKLNLTGGYAISNMQYNDDAVIDEDNAAWWAGLHYGGHDDTFAIGVGYKSIDPLYAAPGAWGRLGATWNPVDIQGFYVNGHLKIGDRLRLMAGGSFYNGRETDSSALSNDDEITNIKVGLNYAMSGSSSAYLNWENTVWSFDGDSAEPTQTWFTLGFNFGLSSNTNLKLFWQMSDIDADGNSFFAPFGNNEAKGGLIGTQLSVKF
jgi:hypothetical protein